MARISVLDISEEQFNKFYKFLTSQIKQYKCYPIATDGKLYTTGTRIFIEDGKVKRKCYVLAYSRTDHKTYLTAKAFRKTDCEKIVIEANKYIKSNLTDFPKQVMYEIRYEGGLE